MAGGNTPHIMEFETKRMASFADKGLLLEFTKYAARRRSAGSGTARRTPAGPVRQRP